MTGLAHERAISRRLSYPPAISSRETILAQPLADQIAADEGLPLGELHGRDA
jgi:hypothetical protein